MADSPSGSAILRVGSAEASEMAHHHRRREGVVLDFTTPGVRDKAGLFACARDQLPLDPPLTPPPVGRPVWDALEDSFWEGVFQLGVDDVLLVWDESAMLEERSPEDFRLALSVFQQMAESLIKPEFTSGRPVRFRVAIAD